MIDEAVTQVVREAVRQVVTEMAAPSVAPEPTPPSREEPRRAVSVAEAASELGLSRSTIYNLISSDRLPSLHLGGRRLVPTWALEEFVGRERTEPSQPCRYCGQDPAASYRRHRGRPIAPVFLCTERDRHQLLLNDLIFAQVRDETVLET